MGLMSLIQAPKGSGYRYYLEKIDVDELISRGSSEDMLRYLYFNHSPRVAEEFCRRGRIEDLRIYLGYRPVKPSHRTVKREFLYRASGDDLLTYLLFIDMSDPEVYDIFLERATPGDCIGFLLDKEDDGVFETFLKRAHPMDCVCYLHEIGYNESVEELLFKLVSKEDEPLYRKMIKESVK